MLCVFTMSMYLHYTKVTKLKAKLEELLALKKRHDEKIPLLNAAERAYNSNISIADKLEIVRQLGEL